ncbi:MAG: 4'-phosphopantetheinyl transferase superfamily protein [Streptosporangiaceae bacterium]|jgi:4'-phosphopantetheinyl transferase EntD
MILAESVPPRRPGGLIARILPSAAVAAESVGELPEAGLGLFPAEELAVRTAGPRRRAEFTAGRLCARSALAGLGVPGAPITPGPAGQPQWPAGVTGSITHCQGYRACAVAWATDVTAIGIDAEPDEELPGGLIEAVATGPERAWIRRQTAAMPAVRWERLVFSAKEATAKLWYPLTGQWPGFGELAVFAAPAGTFTVRLPGTGPAPADRPVTMTGRWLARDGLILTAITWNR